MMVEAFRPLAALLGRFFIGPLAKVDHQLCERRAIGGRKTRCRRRGERCTGRVDALAASAASVAVCGAHKVVIASNAMLMIHNQWTYAAGDAEDLRKVATALDQAMEAMSRH